jgi:hypothetical protein
MWEYREQGHNKFHSLGRANTEYRLKACIYAKYRQHYKAESVQDNNRITQIYQSTLGSAREDNSCSAIQGIPLMEFECSLQCSHQPTVSHIKLAHTLFP